jgi:hypothetical protein
VDEGVAMPQLTFLRETGSSSEQVIFNATQLVLAGWTGRDPAALQHHIDELAVLGVAPPSTIPIFYRTAVDLVTTTERLQVLGPDTSGEVEYVLLSFPDGLWFTVGSDQTDRKAESVIGIAPSKQLAGKVLAPTAWRLAEFSVRWDRMRIRSWATIEGRRTLYQDATLGDIRPPAELIEKYAGGKSLPPGTVMMSGTPAAIGGIRPASRFEMAIEDPETGRAIRHAYDIDVLPIVS